MEPITIFAVSVGLVGVCRLTFVAAEFFGKGIYSRGSRPVKCDEWYCFFKTSDLQATKKKDRVTITRGNFERRRRSQHRPRPQAERNLR